jgi:hypothetical protein
MNYHFFFFFFAITASMLLLVSSTPMEINEAFTPRRSRQVREANRQRRAMRQAEMGQGTQSMESAVPSQETSNYQGYDASAENHMEHEAATPRRFLTGRRPTQSRTLEQNSQHSTVGEESRASSSTYNTGQSSRSVPEQRQRGQSWYWRRLHPQKQAFLVSFLHQRMSNTTPKLIGEVLSEKLTPELAREMATNEEEKIGAVIYTMFADETPDRPDRGSIYNDLDEEEQQDIDVKLAAIFPYHWPAEIQDYLQAHLSEILYRQLTSATIEGVREAFHTLKSTMPHPACAWRRYFQPQERLDAVLDKLSAIFGHNRQEIATALDAADTEVFTGKKLLITDDPRDLKKLMEFLAPQMAWHIR